MIRSLYFIECLKRSIFQMALFLYAKSSMGSFAWKSILWSKDLLEKGSIWRIGCGDSVWIYRDDWLPSPKGRISSPAGHLAPKSTVDALIRSLIDLCFYPPEAYLIKSLPLRSIPQPDLVVWRSEKSGCYSVKSGYKLLCELDRICPQVTDS